MVSGEGYGVVGELLEGHASLADALFEQCPWQPVGQLRSHFPQDHR
jgi:hypothetical protein